MFVKWREMFSNSREHIGLNFKGNNQQTQIPAEAEGKEIETSDEAEECLFPRDWRTRWLKILRIPEEKVLSFTTVK